MPAVVVPETVKEVNVPTLVILGCAALAAGIVPYKLPIILAPDTLPVTDTKPEAFTLFTLLKFLVVLSIKRTPPTAIFP